MIAEFQLEIVNKKQDILDSYKQRTSPEQGLKFHKMFPDIFNPQYCFDLRNPTFGSHTSDILFW